MRTAVYDELHGLDEEFTVAYNDVDFCLRVRDAGWRIVWTPYAELYHYESKSRGSDENDPAKKARFDAEHERLYAVHGGRIFCTTPITARRCRWIMRISARAGFAESEMS